jgi:hypothetical protein
MPRQRHRPGPSGPAGLRPSSRTAPAGSLDAGQVHRLAELIADGQCEAPPDLSGADQERLREEVRRLLRARLLSFIARAIAARLQRDPGPTQEGAPHARA